MGPANVFPMENTLPSPIGNAHEANNAAGRRAEQGISAEQFRSTGRSAVARRTLQIPRITADWLSEQRTRPGMGDDRKGSGEEPQNTKPNSKL